MMNIENILSQGENETIEFKTSFQKEVIETVVAMANTKGGNILIGVRDDSSVVGITLEKETIQNYSNQIKNTTQPTIVPNIYEKTVYGKTIVIINIDEFPIKPISCKSRYFKRVNNSNHIMSVNEVANMHLQSLQLSWDAYVSNDYNLKDLDKNKIDIFIKRVNEGKRFLLNNDAISSLNKLHLIKDDKPTNASSLLFAKEQTIYNIHIGRFKTSSTIIDDKMIKATLYEAVEQCMKYILSWIKVAFEFTGDIKRNEIMEYPITAIREIILNAIIHRDYTSPIDTQIKIFDQSITVFNPGKLYGDITLEQLKTDTYQAQTRNKLIAEAFYLTKDTEKYGSGYIRIREAIASYPTMSFKYEEIGNGYLVTLEYEKQKTTSIINKGINKGINEGINEGINILASTIKNQPGYRVPYYAQKLNISDKTVERWIKELKNRDEIYFKGSKKTGGYWKK